VGIASKPSIAAVNIARNIGDCIDSIARSSNNKPFVSFNSLSTKTDFRSAELTSKTTHIRSMISA